MKGYQFEDTQGTFHLKKAENISYLYFPIAGEAGLKSSFTPNLGGDAKIDQNTFLLEPVSAENLVNNRNSRNFWCNVKGIGSWSLTGHSAEELSKKFTEMQDDSEVTAGFMWQKTTRESKKYQLRGEILSFILLTNASTSIFFPTVSLEIDIAPALIFIVASFGSIFTELFISLANSIILLSS